jgi:C-terminal processing protease CtpA/Prc
MGSVPRNGTIGGETLSRFTVVFNFPKEEIYLKKNNAFKKGFHYNLSGLNVKAKGSKLNVFEITEVREQSAAHRAGVSEGDLIVSINGVPSSQINLAILNAFFNLRPGKKIHLTLDRKGQKIRKDFRLEDQI